MRRWVAAALVVASLAARAVAGPPREGVAAGSPLPVEAVTALLQDRAGFLWVGSREGLILYDGYISTTFEHDVADPSSISDNAIRVIFEDSRGRLWIGTNSGGLDELDRAAWRFRSFRHDGNDPGSIANDSVYAIAEDATGALWIGTQSGLDRFDPDRGRFEKVEGLSHPYVDTLLVAPDALWIGTVGGGLNRLDTATGAIKVFRSDPHDPGTIGSDRVYTLAAGDGGTIFVGSEAGVDRLDPVSGRAAAVPFPDRRPQLTTSLGVAADGTVWAGTFASGLFALVPGAPAFAHEPSVGIPRVICVLADRSGRVWVGTWGAGLARVPRGAATITPVAIDGTEAETTAVLEDGVGNLWSGEPLGLVRREPSGRTLRLPELGAAVALSQSRDGRLFVGTPNDCAAVDPRSGRLLWRANPPAPKEPIVGPGWIWAVLPDRSGRLWIGTGGGGLFRLRADGGYDRFRHDPREPGSLSDDYVVSLLETRDGSVWVGTRSGGLNVLPPGAAQFIRCAPSPDDPRSISHHNVLALLEDTKGAVWVGTGGGGLDRATREPSGRIVFTRFTEDDGLIDDNVTSLSEDDDGSLWIGTRRGLTRFDPKTGRFASYGSEDGLPSVEFANGAVSAGRLALYFGTHRGVVAVSRGTPFPEPRRSPTVLRSVRTLSGPIVSSRPSWSEDRVEVPYGESLTFELAVLDFGDRRRHRYAYRLEGLSDGWVDLGARREVTLTHLDPGRYRLFARGRNDQGVWSDAPVVLDLHVVPPFWMTAWFRVLGALAVVAAALGVHRVRTAGLTRRNRELVLLKEQRERALDEVGASRTALEEAYARLRALTRRLEAAQEDERKRIARELHDEMGQILTTAKLNLQLASGLVPEGDRARRMDDAIALIDRLIGHVRALSLDLRPPLLDELGLVAALRGYLEAQARHSGLAIDLADARLPGRLPAGVEIAAFRVVQEAVTNVLRHARARRVTVELRYDPGWLALHVADDGGGFDVSTLERAPPGRHLGLAGMRERVESMGGTIAISSTPGSGTAIDVRLPVEA